MTAAVLEIHAMQLEPVGDYGCWCGTCRLWSCPTCGAMVYQTAGEPPVEILPGVSAILGTARPVHLGPWLAGPYPITPAAARTPRQSVPSWLPRRRPGRALARLRARVRGLADVGLAGAVLARIMWTRARGAWRWGR